MVVVLCIHEGILLVRDGQIGIRCRFGIRDPFMVSVKVYMVVTASGFHLFPFRTEKLSPTSPMVLQCNVGE